MFERMRKWINSVKYTILPVATIQEALGVELAVSTDMANAIDLWDDMFRDEAPWLFDPRRPAESLGLPAAIASELARLITIEMESEVTGSARADYLNVQYQPVLGRLRQSVEFGAAKGGLIFKPYIDDGNIVVDYTQADSFYPTAFDSSGRLSGVVFIEQIVRKDKLYRRLEYHHLEPEGCVIENKAYVNSALAGTNQVMLGKPIPLTAVDEWASLSPSLTIQHVDRLLMGFFRMPLANTVDSRSPLGVSCYSRAINLIRQADEQWARIMWEFEGSELAIHADQTLFKRDSFEQWGLPAGRDRLYRTVHGIDMDKPQFDIFSPAIRDSSLFNGLNNILKRIEYQCALAYGTLSDPQNVDKTAEEIRSSKQRSYATVKDTQKALQSALDDLVYAMDVWATVGGLAPPGAYETAYDWDDSIINDPVARKQMFWGYVQAGKFPAWRYFRDFEGYSEDDAKAIMAEMEGASLNNPYGFGGGA